MGDKVIQAGIQGYPKVDGYPSAFEYRKVYPRDPSMGEMVEVFCDRRFDYLDDGWKETPLFGFPPRTPF